MRGWPSPPGVPRARVGAREVATPKPKQKKRLADTPCVCLHIPPSPLRMSCVWLMSTQTRSALAVHRPTDFRATRAHMATCRRRFVGTEAAPPFFVSPARAVASSPALSLLSVFISYLGQQAVCRRFQAAVAASQIGLRAGVLGERGGKGGAIINHPQPTGQFGPTRGGGRPRCSPFFYVAHNPRRWWCTVAVQIHTQRAKKGGRKKPRTATAPSRKKSPACARVPSPPSRRGNFFSQTADTAPSPCDAAPGPAECSITGGGGDDTLEGTARTRSCKK